MAKCIRIAQETLVVVDYQERLKVTMIKEQSVSMPTAWGQTCCCNNPVCLTRWQLMVLRTPYHSRTMNILRWFTVLMEQDYRCNKVLHVLAAVKTPHSVCNNSTYCITVIHWHLSRQGWSQQAHATNCLTVHKLCSYQWLPDDIYIG